MKTTSILRITIYILVIVMSTSSWALSITVTNINDSGEGTLRQAVADVAISSSDDTIVFDPSLTGQTIFLTSGPLDIDVEVITINGLGAENLTISGSDRSTAFIVNSGSQLVIDGLKITDTTPYAVDIQDDFSGTKLTLSNCIVSNNDRVNSSEEFAAINGFGEVVVDNCDISNNIGTAIDISGISLIVRNSTITGSEGTAIRGGFRAREDDEQGINLLVSDSTISNNLGDGIAAIETTLKLINSTVSGNGSTGIVNLSSGDAEIIGSTIANNTGGGIFITGAKDSEEIGSSFGGLRVTNSTISGNSDGSGGGIYVENRQEENSSDGPVELTITLTNTTITNNSAATQGGGILIVPDQGSENMTNVTVNNSILAGNSAPTNPDVAGDFISNGFNLVGIPGDSTGFEEDLIEPDITNILDSDLKDNGGFTQTHNLLPGSVAIDAAATDCPPPETDQRGVPRLQGTGCDIGAVEFQEIDMPPVEASMCEIRTQYESGSCKGQFRVFSLEDLEVYKTTNFGKQGRKNYRNLVIKADIGSLGDNLDIESPCEIIVNNGVNLTGDFVSLDGRKGVWSRTNINSAGPACLLSENGRVKLKSGSNITASKLVVQGNKIVKIGKNTQVNVSDSVTVQSTGSTSKSRTIIDKGANLLVGSDMTLGSNSRTVIQNDAVIDVAGNLEMNAKSLKTCIVKKSAEVSFDSKSGVCAAKLP